MNFILKFLFYGLLGAFIGVGSYTTLNWWWWWVMDIILMAAFAVREYIMYTEIKNGTF